jgi:Na+/H+-dicarboxylate symporter
MSLTTRVVLGLGAGLALGLALGAAGVGEPLARWIEPVGTIWINAIRMTIIPLVMSLIVVGILEAGDMRRIGGLGVRAVALFILMLTAAAIFTGLLATPLYSGLQLDPAATARLRASAAEVPPAISAAASARDFLLSLVPANPIRAAADSAMLPFLVFALLFALAASRIGTEERDLVHRFFRALRDAVFVLIRWILAVAPIGVFALGFALSTRLGGAAVGAIGYYILLVIVLHIVTGIGLYAVATIFGRVPLRVFARAVAPAQAVGFSSRSSYASLPALIDGAQRVLRLPADVTGFVLPLAVATFKLTSPIYWTLGAMLVARLYGIDMGPGAIALVAGAAVLLNAATPGIPSGGLLIQAPVYMAAGLPVEGIGLLIAIDAIPDMFKTAYNVTADMAVAVIVARTAGRPAG